MINFSKLEAALIALDGDDKRILREEFFKPAAVDCAYSEPEVGVFSDPSLEAVFNALVELVE